jgi:peptidoglycan/LPS O-acetylase OafA/YrhL
MPGRFVAARLRGVYSDVTGSEKMRTNRALDYSPSLDGLRALCLIAVLLFHSGFEWASGGFLGVSTFFTLSGYLITTILLAERRESGSISLSAFWARRMRRLAPASLLAIATIVVTAPVWIDLAGREVLTTDVLSALVYATNWRLLLGGYEYTLIFTEPSPLQHFWSLAIEAQFYVAFPLIVSALARGGDRGTRIGLFVLAAVSALLPFAYEDTTRIYYGTDTRVSELLVGACLAIALTGRRNGGTRAGAMDNITGIAGIAALIAAWMCSSLDSVWLYRGGFTLYAIGSAAVVYVALVGGPVARLLSLPGLPWLGRISYGAYVFHWPIFLAVGPEETGLTPLPLFGVRLALTLVVSAISYRFIEAPVRRSGSIFGGAFGRAAAAFSVVVAFAALVTSPAGFRLQALSYADTVRAAFFSPARDDSAITISVFGDSTALRLAFGFPGWTQELDNVRLVPGMSLLNCGLLKGRHLARGAWRPTPEHCGDYTAKWGEAAKEQTPDIALVLTGNWEVRTRILESDVHEIPREPGDPLLDDATSRGIDAALDALEPSTGLVIWLMAPSFSAKSINGKFAQTDIEASAPWRIAHFNELVREAAAQRPAQMRVIDLAAYLEDAAERGEDQVLRPDGVHLSLAGSTQLLRSWLGDEILSTYRQWQRTSGGRR